MKNRGLKKWLLGIMLCFEVTIIAARPGLQNLGNTCYINAAVQFLYMIEPFRELLIAKSEELTSDPLIRELARLFKQMKESKDGVLAPQDFVNEVWAIDSVINFPKKQMHDAFLLLNHIFLILEKEDSSVILQKFVKPFVIFLQNLCYHFTEASYLAGNRMVRAGEKYLVFHIELNVLPSNLDIQKLISAHHFSDERCEAFPCYLPISISTGRGSVREGEGLSVNIPEKIDRQCLSGRVEYALVAVIININKLHYWAYTRDDDGWREYNDSTVSNLLDWHIVEGKMKKALPRQFSRVLLYKRSGNCAEKLQPLWDELYKQMDQQKSLSALRLLGYEINELNVLKKKREAE